MRTRSRLGVLLLSAAAILPSDVRAAAAPRQEAKPDPEGVEFFETRIRPVLVESCYSCHSAGAKSLKGGLRLDTREASLKGGDSGAAVVPGHPEESLLVRAIRFKDPELKMPPKKKLPPEVVADFEAWVRRGAPDPRTGGPAALKPTEEAGARHWAYQAPREPAVPPVKDPLWSRNPVDAFVRARLDQAGFAPQPRADKRTLLRRASIGLTGLPPTAAEIRAFEADAAPDAFARRVDELLARPEYGERWARHWMDVARYSDTKGYTFQEERRFPHSYTYRDWLIRAFNEDLPYDRFLVLQMAADRLGLDGPEQRHLAAMGFLTLGRRFLNRLPDIIDDRLDVVFRGTQATTVVCARCHDHKYDPVSIKDYYSLYGVFASSVEPKELPLLAQEAAKSPDVLAYEQELAKRQAEVEEFRRTQHRQITAKLREPKAVAAYLELAAEAIRKNSEEPLRKLEKRDSQFPIVALRWHALLRRTEKDPGPLWGVWHALAALKDGEFGAKAAEALAAVKDPHPKLAEAFKTPPASLKEAAERYGAVLASLKGPLEDDDAPPSVPFANLDEIYTRAERDKQRQLQNKVDGLHATHPGAPARAMVLQDGAIMEPSVFIRGNPSSLGERVSRRFLPILSGGRPEPFKEGSGRLEMARRIASKENPLTARVMVNRVWAQHFGRGLVGTPSDFGLRSDLPTHPELLDWLALRFMEDGWSVKKLHRRILLSETWQQASGVSPGPAAKDPDNLLLWRQNRRRLDFEAMRDSLLKVSGQLDPARGGRGVEISENPTARSRMQAETIVTTVGDPNQERYSLRRSVYLFIDRQNLPGTFRVFDVASPDTHSPQRFTTTVPQQALFLMNSPFLQELARGLTSLEEVASAKEPAERIRRLYLAVYGRSPSPEELALGRGWIEREGEPAAALTGGASGWQHGYGIYDEAARRLKSFTPFPHFEGKAWQGGPKMPDGKLGWLLLTAEGGHPGNPAQGAVVRRWTAPADLVVSIHGVLAHRQSEGDGVRARIVSSRQGELASWTAHHTEAETSMSRVEVRAGESIDFVVDCRGNEGWDSFMWAPELRTVEPVAATGAGREQVWTAKAGFQGPAGKARPFGAWERYAQALLLSNEFNFLD